MTKALYGIKVFDLTRLLPGAICSLVLADMGADVIKIEDTGAGDYARSMPPYVNDMGAFFRVSNRNKRSLSINLKEVAGQEVFHRLIMDADVLIEGFRPEVTQRLKVDYPTLSALNPRLVYCSLSGWGQSGVYKERSGHDLNYVALHGLLGGMREPQPLGGQIADVGGAYVGVMGILAALLKRERSKEGDYIDVSLSESAIPFALYQLVESLVIGTKGGQSALTGHMAYYNVYKSSDNRAMALGAIEVKFWENFCKAIGRSDWIARHSDILNQAALKTDLTSLFATKTAEEWESLLGEVDCCFTLVRSPESILQDPQIQARSILGEKDGLPWMRSPVRLMSDDSFVLGTVPKQGENSAEILEESGFSADVIAQLQASGIVGKSG
jgi:alpha-methylacyl-CoA racemase